MANQIFDKKGHTPQTRVSTYEELMERSDPHRRRLELARLRLHEMNTDRERKRILENMKKLFDNR